MHRPVAFARVAALAALSAAALGAPPAALSAGGGSQEVAAMERLVNATRRSRGLPSLRASVRLRRSAQLRSVAIRRCGEFSHTPCGQPFGAPFVDVGYLRGLAVVAENLAWGSSSLGQSERVLAAWLRSAPHRANLLARRWRDVGIAAVRVQSLFGMTNVTLWVVQFGRRG